LFLRGQDAGDGFWEGVFSCPVIPVTLSYGRMITIFGNQGKNKISEILERDDLVPIVKKVSEVFVKKDE
jgi:hypothetical protein